VFGELTLRLLPPPDPRLTLLVPFERMAQAAGAVMDIVEQGLGPRCLELLDLASRAAASWPELVGPAAGRRGAGRRALLLIEVDGTRARV
jgi:FAD/FMN-containing dehydrogenase